MILLGCSSPVKTDYILNTNILNKTLIYKISRGREGQLYPIKDSYKKGLVAVYKDTLINKKTFYCIAESVFTKNLISIDTLINNYKIYIGKDSVIILCDSGIPEIGLFKQLKSNQENLKHLQQELYYYSCLLLPLQVGNSWYVAPQKTANGAKARKKVVGEEDIITSLGTFHTWKIEWDWSETLLNSYGLKRTEWIDNNNLIKREFNLGVFVPYDDLDDSSGLEVAMVEKTEYIGNNIDSIKGLVPFINDKNQDSVFKYILLNWDYSKFKNWLNAYDQDVFGTYVQDDICDTLNAFTKCVWGKSAYDIDPMGIYGTNAMSIINEETFPTKKEDFSDWKMFMAFALNARFIQGWSDCDFNWTNTNTYKAHPYPFGQSKLRNGILSYIYY